MSHATDPVTAFLQAYHDTVWRKDAEGYAASFAQDVAWLVAHQHRSVPVGFQSKQAVPFAAQA